MSLANHEFRLLCVDEGAENIFIYSSFHSPKNATDVRTSRSCCKNPVCSSLVALHIQKIPRLTAIYFAL